MCGIIRVPRLSGRIPIHITIALNIHTAALSSFERDMGRHGGLMPYLERRSLSL